MKAIVTPSALEGKIAVPSSKSCVHRLLICSALSDDETNIVCSGVSDDITATVSCLNSLCADINKTENGFTVAPKKEQGSAIMDCFESGSTYRFLLPVACALGRECTMLLGGRLPERPMEALWDTLEENGAVIGGKGSNKLHISGKLSAGVYTVPGNISSQYISGLLFALPLLHGDSEIRISGNVQSVGYLQMTLSAVRRFGIDIKITDNIIYVAGNQKYISPKKLIAEGDWSNSAFFMCSAAAKGSISCAGLSTHSSQGDRAVCDLLRRFGAVVSESESEVSVSGSSLQGITIDAADIPDLVPALAVAACAAIGKTVIKNAERLRLKESDRLETIFKALSALGADIEITDDGLIIRGKGELTGGITDSYNDHRIAMMAAAASCICKNKVIIENADAVRKSYPTFFEDFTALKGIVETEEL